MTRRLVKLDRSPTAPRRGLITAELIFVLPIFLALVLATVEFGLLMTASEQVQLAAATACRVGTQPSSDLFVLENQVNLAAQAALVSPRLQTNAAISFTPGVVPGDQVTVSISVPMTAASPDLLAFIGFSLNNRFLTATVVMIQQ